MDLVDQYRRPRRYASSGTMCRSDGRNTAERPKFLNQQCSAGQRREIWKDEDSVEVEDSGIGQGYKSEPQANSYKKVINQNGENGVPIEITYTNDHRTSKRPLHQPRLQEVKQQYTSRTSSLSSSSVMHIEQIPQSERFSTKANAWVNHILLLKRGAHV
ncbi:hypothetical protein CSKR_111252 [Clonorchis sinensis]|uniref:Uncharacterized protein n=1 Tax=Clonorchis sinensis TaxID=79923 RepID=A0A8T1MSN8_CLOSI|nr:hypothetical protein CSKR_111252 [Clonorchis sinensis]